MGTVTAPGKQVEPSDSIVSALRSMRTAFSMVSGYLGQHDDKRLSIIAIRKARTLAERTSQ